MAVDKLKMTNFKTTTVKHGPESKLFFICLSGLQPETVFKDLWMHLRRAVRRIEHIEVFRDTQTAWVCILRAKNFRMGLEALQHPVRVAANEFASNVNISATNVNRPLKIRCPKNRSEYVVEVMKRAELHSNEETAEADELVEDDKPVVARKTMNRLRQIVIAHGSYVPGVVNNSSNIAMSCSPNGFGGWTFRGSHWCTGSPYTTSTVSSLNLAGSPPLPESHTVFLSGFHHETTLRQIRTMVEEISCHYELIDRNIHFVDGSTIVISNEVDAKRLTDALNGYVFHGASIVASYGQRPYEFGTYPYPQTHPYLGFQGRGQDWQQESGQFWHQY